MAIHALTPASSPANHDRTAFNLALARYAHATAAQAALPQSRCLTVELAAAEAVERAHAHVTATAAPDLFALATKLRIALSALPQSDEICDALTVDLRRLSTQETRA